MLDQTRLKQLFDYSPDTGLFTFLPRPESDFATHRAFKIFISKCEGKTAGWSHGAGYVAIRIEGSDYLAHRLAWLWMTGGWPSDEIDHKNGKRSDNRWENLRDATKLQNSHNQSLRITNKSGTNGVFMDKRRGGWRAEIVQQGRSIYLGQFKSIEEAVAARKGAEKALGFSKGHGKDRQGEYYKPRKPTGSSIHSTQP